MVTQDLSLSKTLNPSSSLHHSISLRPFFSNPIRKALPLRTHQTHKPLSISSTSLNYSLSVPRQSSPFSFANLRREIRAFAGRSKKKGGGPSPGRIEGNAEFRQQLKRTVRKKNQKLAESNFYRRKKSSSNYADNFSEDELQQIGLGYDRMVRFMEKDDPNLRHPYDWYKYGEYGPYSWRGVVVGEPIRGRFTDERVTLIGGVKDHEEWEEIEQSEMSADFSERLQRMDKSKGFRYFWVFVRHPRWKISESPWQQWTLISEVVIEAGKERLDKWSLMGRLGNKSRKSITQCAAWMRPDVIYVKKPVYQCRFEPQDNFFQAMMPFLDPKTEQDFLFELQNDEGNVEWVTYFAGLCKIVRVNPKAFVDDVVKAYEKLSDEKKSKCLEFLLTNHPVQLLHPYTKEWKAKLEEEELGCDAPDDNENLNRDDSENVISEWIEVDDENDDTDNGDDIVMEAEEQIGVDDNDDDDIDNAYDDDDGIDNAYNDDDDDIDNTYNDDDDNDDEVKGAVDETDTKEEDLDGEEDENYWDERFKKLVSSPEEMEKLFKRSAKLTDDFYENQMGNMENGGKRKVEEDGDERELRGKRVKVKQEEWEYIGRGPMRKRIRRCKIPPELFLRSAVRHFTYRNLVKEIVLTRHAILDGEISV